MSPGWTRSLTELRELGAQPLSQRTDVTRGDEMEAFAERVLDGLGGVHSSAAARASR
jgi:hypothetical protein